MKKTQLPMPKRPFRDSAILYAVLAAVFVLIAWATGGSVLPRFDSDNFEIGALPLALGCFVLATAYSWWRFRRRIDEERRSS